MITYTLKDDGIVEAEETKVIKTPIDIKNYKDRIENLRKVAQQKLEEANKLEEELINIGKQLGIKIGG